MKRYLRISGRFIPTLMLWLMALAYGSAADAQTGTVGVLRALGVTYEVFIVAALVSGALLIVWRPIKGFNAFTAFQYLLFTLPGTIYILAALWHSFVINPSVTRMPAVLYVCAVLGAFIAYWLAVDE